MPGSVECPRCGRVTQADGIWLWVAGQGERLRVENGSIVQSGHVDVFDLGCGCKFETDLWSLSVTTSLSVRSGGTVGVSVVAKPAVPFSGNRRLVELLRDMDRQQAEYNYGSWDAWVEWRNDVADSIGLPRSLLDTSDD